MECDNPKVYKDTSIFDGLVVNVIIMLIDVDLDEGRMAVPNRINFRKSSKGVTFPRINPSWRRPPSLKEPYPTLEVIKTTSLRRYNILMVLFSFSIDEVPLCKTFLRDGSRY